MHDQTGHTTVFVTHDQEEALELADRVVVMNNGRIEQVGTPDEVYDRPATPFVFEFIGDSSALPVTVDKGHVFLDDRVLALDAKGQPDGPATLFFRPNHVELVVRRTRTAARSSASCGGSRRIGDIRRLELEAGLARHRFEIDVPIDADVNLQGRIAFRIVKWRLVPWASRQFPCRLTPARLRTRLGRVRIKLGVRSSPENRTFYATACISALGH